MGTRADFYVGRGKDAEWLGSVAFDGWPGGFKKKLWKCESEDEWRRRVAKMLAERDDATTPDMGWPWPWEDSRTTDFAYAFDGGEVYASCFGCEWHDPKVEPPEDLPRKVAVFPDMTARQKVARAGSDRSGCLSLVVPMQK